MGYRLAFRFYPLLLLAAVLGIGVLLAWESETLVEDQRTEFRQVMQQSARESRDEIAKGLARLHQLAKLFSVEQAAAISRLYKHPADIQLRFQLEAKIQAYFPAYFAFTITDVLGDPVLADNLGQVGKGCRADLAEFAGSAFSTLHVYTPYMHFNRMAGGFSRHFDVMVPWENGSEGIFFVSVRDAFLQRHMMAHERAGFELLLLRHDALNKVELAAEDGIVAAKIYRTLDETEVRRLINVGDIEGTRWVMAALPDLEFMRQQANDVRMRAFLAWLVSSGVLIGVAFLLRHERRVNMRLNALNSDLANEVKTREQTEAQLRQLVDYDPLTGLPNRKSANEFLQHVLAMASRQGLRPAVLFFDIDRFSDFNDSLGHGYGDVLLKETAQRIQSHISPEDLFARWGGDEFLVIVQHAPERNRLAQFAGQLLELMREPVAMHRSEVRATISIGIATYPEAGKETEALLKNADLAMYRAKNEGRNRSRFFIQEMDDQVSARLRLESEVRQAMLEDAFVPWYQPQVDLRTGLLTGAEALMRWQHPEQGVRLPASFLDALEENALIDTVGDAVRKHILADKMRWHESGLSVGSLAINLSGKEFFRPGLIDQLHAQLLEVGLSGTDFEIEITESHLMSHTAESLEKLHALKHLGFSLAVDDFGTGYSSLSYLKRFPVDVLKIDRSFVVDSVSNQEDKDILSAIVQLAHSLSLKVVAEGVETVEQLTLLRQLGCDQMQGFLLARPMPAEEFEQFVATYSGRLPV